MKFDFDDIIIVPETISAINSRSEVFPYDENGMLPLMTAPMDRVVDSSNYQTFIDNNIITTLPRNESIFVSSDPFCFHSYGLKEFKAKFIDNFCERKFGDNIYAMIDVANGNMQQIFHLVKKAKEIYNDTIVLIVGNIGNPRTYEEYCKIGVNYVRCGIGNGSVCLTTANVGVGYPMGSLINECFKIKRKGQYKTKIIADGGFKKYSDIIKALAIGADYVMLGSMFNKAIESCGPCFYKKDDKWFKYDDKILVDPVLIEEELKNKSVYKIIRGMSTKEVQKKWGKEKLQTSEGIFKFNQVEYTLKGFVENFTDYLKSAMSYTNSRTLEEFKNSQFELITQNAFNRFDK